MVLEVSVEARVCLFELEQLLAQDFALPREARQQFKGRCFNFSGRCFDFILDFVGGGTYQFPIGFRGQKLL